MERRNGAALCPRLIDYFVIVAGRNPASSHRAVCTSPEILRRYPLKDHDDFPLPADVSFFCQPEGCLNVTRQQILQVVNNSSFVFCLTDKDTNKVRYGICYSFYQLRSFDRHHSSGGSAAAENDGFQEVTPEKGLLSAPGRGKGKKRYQLISMCLLSHHPFFTTFRDILVALKKLIDRYEEPIRRLIRSHHLPLKSIWDFLLTEAPNHSLAQLVNQDTREIDTYILRLLSSPVPVPGKTRIEITLGPTSFHVPVVFALPDRTRFSLVDFPMHLILDLLGIDKCLLVLTAILLESKVVLQSRDYNALTMSVLGFIALLYPLEYMFPVIPLLPTCLRGAENLLLAPTPFLIGAPATFLMYKADFALPDDIWLFNLDTGEIQAPTRLEKLPSLPEPEGSLLKRSFSQALASLSLANVPVTERGQTSQQPADPETVDVAIRMAMVKFFVSENVLGNWSDHTRIMRLYPRPVIGFQHNTFLKSRPAGCHFTAQLVKTQAVECFCEWALCPDNDAWLRVLSGLAEPHAVGDKARWFAQSLSPVSFSLIDSQSTLWKRLCLNEENGRLSIDNYNNDQPTDESCSGDDSDTGSVSSGAGLTELCISDMLKHIPELAPGCGPPKRLSVEEDEVYAPPVELQLPETSKAHSVCDSDSEAASSRSCQSGSSSPCSSRSPSQHGFDDDEQAFALPLNAGTLQQPSLAERRGVTSQLEPVDTSHQSHPSSSSDKDRTPQPDGERIVPFSPEASKSPTASGGDASAKRRNFSQTDSSGSSESSGVDMTTKDIFAAMKSDVADIAHSAKAKAKTATSKLSGFLDEVAAAKQKGDSSRNVPNRPQLPRQGSTQGPTRPPPPNRAGQPGPSAATPSSASGNGKNPSHVQPLLAASEALRKHLPSPQARKRNPLTGGGNQMQNPMPHQKEDLDRAGHVRRSYRASADLAQRQQCIDAKSQQHIENQQFLSDVVQILFEGQTVGWLKLNRLRRVLEDETYRLFLLSKMNTQLSKKYRDEDSHIEDMVLSRKQFKAFIVVLRATITGLETSYRSGASGGMASAFLLLEVAHTHYWQPEYGLRDPDLAPAMLSPHSQSVNTSAHHSRANSPFGSREHLASGSTTPSREDTTLPDHHQINPPKRPNELTNRSAEFPPEPDTCRRSSGSSGTPPNEQGRVTVGPTSGAGLLKSALLRRGDSNDSLSSLNSPSGSRSGASDPNIFPKTILTTGYRYRGGRAHPIPRGAHPCREYLFQHIVGKERSWLWDQMGFWEEAFIDAIAHERDLVGYDMNPQEMILRYGNLIEAERKRLELDEDRLLAVLLFDAASFMLMMACNKNEIRRKIRRLLGKSHLGLLASQNINQLLNSMNYLNGNDIDLRVPASRLVRRYTFPVHLGTDNSGEMLFVEVCGDSVVLRSVSGQQRDRWWFDRLINMTYSPRTKVLCLWMKNAGDQVELNQFYTRKCRELYNRIKSAMEQTAALNRLSRPGPNLYAEFPVTKLNSDEKAVVQVTPEDQESGALRQLKFISEQADQICYNVLCVISMVASAASASNSSSTTSSLVGQTNELASQVANTRLPSHPQLNILPAQSNPLAVNLKMDTLSKK